MPAGPPRVRTGTIARRPLAIVQLHAARVPSSGLVRALCAPSCRARAFTCLHAEVRDVSGTETCTSTSASAGRAFLLPMHPRGSAQTVMGAACQ
ncbi:hypothetical protein BD309DRAFT_950938 [Dichomitus squalens]|nr:hypothetical protein BD309DRAFT_950938 [Dichomitus squalens]